MTYCFLYSLQLEQSLWDKTGALQFLQAEIFAFFKAWWALCMPTLDFDLCFTGTPPIVFNLFYINSNASVGAPYFAD